MSEDVNQNLSQGAVLKAFIENRYGSKVYEAYSAAIDSGEIATNKDAVAFLDKKARTIEGKLLTEPQLERHDEKVIDEIKRLLGEKKGLELAKFYERRLLGIAEKIGYALPAEYNESRESGKRLTKTYVEGLAKYIKDNFGSNPEQLAELRKQVEHFDAAKNTLEGELLDTQQANHAMQIDIDRLNAAKEDAESQKASLETKLAEASQENSSLQSKLEKFELYEQVYFTVNKVLDKSKDKINETGGNTNGQ